MHTLAELSRHSICAFLGLTVLTMSACTDSDNTASVKSAVNNFCQNENKLTPGTAEYEKCVAERTDYIVQASRRGALF